MNDTQPTLSFGIEDLITTLTEQFSWWDNDFPLVDAISCVEHLAEAMELDLPEVRGMAWVQYRSYLVGLQAALRVCEEYRLPDRVRSELDAAVLACGGSVEVGAQRWATGTLAEHIGDADTVDDILEDIVERLVAAFEEMPA